MCKSQGEIAAPEIGGSLQTIDCLVRWSLFPLAFTDMENHQLHGCSLEF